MTSKIGGLSIILFLFVMVSSCNSKSSDDKSAVDSIKESIDINNPTLVKLNNRLFSIPSPIQVALMVKKMNVGFHKQLMNDPAKAANYTTDFKRALNLGIYSTNLGYLNIFEQYPDAAKYFNTVRALAKDLGIVDVFDKETMQRIEKNSSNKDSMVSIIANINRNADSYLMNNDRNNISVLILAGGWVESLYLMTQYNKNSKSTEINEKIGEQKHPLENLIELLRPYYEKQSEDLDRFIESLVDLATIFDGVEIDYVYQKPSVEEDKKLTIINSTSKTVINDYQLKTITQNIEKIRSKIIE